MRWTRRQRILWFARQIEIVKDKDTIERWRWWRAHKVASIIERIMDEAGITKPVWVYTLGWDHGREHGQDPVMFFDAGVSVDAVMLYEASRPQFVRLLGQWNRYVRSSEGNIFIGNCVDANLLDSDRFLPPDEFFRRNTEGYRNIVRDGLASGIFFHDIARGLWGRRGGHEFREYALAHMSSVYGLRRELSELDLIVDIRDDGETPGKTPGDLRGILRIKNNSTVRQSRIIIRHINTDDLDIFFHDESGGRRPFEYHIADLNTFESRSVPFSGEMREATTLVRFSVATESGLSYFVSTIMGPENALYTVEE
jgi:hypothetical protein